MHLPARSDMMVMMMMMMMMKALFVELTNMTTNLVLMHVWR